MRFLFFTVTLLLFLSLSSCKKEKDTDTENVFSRQVLEIKPLSQTGGETVISHFHPMDNSVFGIGINESTNSVPPYLVFGVGNIDLTKPENRIYELRSTIESRPFDGQRTVGFYNELDKSEIVVLANSDSFSTTIRVYKVYKSQYTEIADEFFTGKVELNNGIKLPDGYLLLGSRTLNNGVKDICVIRYDESFTISSVHTFSGNANQMAMDGVLLNDGSAAILAYTYSNTMGDRDALLLKYSLNTNDTLYTRLFGGEYYDEPQEITKGNDGRLYISGHSASFGSLEHDGYLLCIEENFDKVWEKTFGTPHHDGFNTITLNKSGNMIIAAGRSMQGMGQPEDVFVVATDLNGNELWRKKYGNSALTELPLGIAADDEFYYIACNRVGIDGKYSAIFVKDKLGN